MFQLYIGPCVLNEALNFRLDQFKIGGREFVGATKLPRRGMDDRARADEITELTLVQARQHNQLLLSDTPCALFYGSHRGACDSKGFSSIFLAHATPFPRGL
jgi:hypothetical protein